MQRRVLFVRAINVGGTAALPMRELRELLTELEATEVVTFIASGNVVASVPGDPDVFDRALEAAIQTRYGWFREVMSRTPAEVREALAAHPFEVVDPKFSYVSFLSAEPSADAIEAAADVRSGDDRWAVIGRQLHLRYAAGAGQATLNQEALTRRLGVAATARNLRTVEKLIALSR